MSAGTLESMRLLSCLLLAGSAACGTDTFVSGDGGDAGGAADAQDVAVADAPADAPSAKRCDPSAPWGMPKPMAELDTMNVDDVAARLTADALNVAFVRTTNNGPDLFAGHRNNLTAPFSSIGPWPGTVNTPDTETWPSISGGELYFARSMGGGDYVLMMATAPNYTDAAAVVSLNPSGSSNFAPYVLSGGKVMYFSRRDQSGMHILRAVHLAAGWGNVVDTNLALTAQTDLSAAVTPDELEAYWASDRGGAGLDVWTSARKSASDPWGAATRVDALSSPITDIPTWISPDACTILLTTGTNSMGSGDILYATRQ